MGSELGVIPIPQRPARRHGVDEEAETLRTDSTFRWPTGRRIRYPMPSRLFAIGDIHGCSTALKVLIEAIAPWPEDTIVVLGDVIDWGPNSRDCVQQLIDLSNRCRFVLDAQTQSVGQHDFNALDRRRLEHIGDDVHR